jgi:hypothetical protein
MILGEFWGSPNSSYKFLSQYTSLLASDIATYLASVDDNATVVCFLDLHMIAPPPDINTYPEVDLWSSVFAKAASEYP